MALRTVLQILTPNLLDGSSVIFGAGEGSGIRMFNFERLSKKNAPE
jgi:hypothetical protein